MYGFPFCFKYLWHLSNDTFSSYSGGLWSKVMLKAGQSRSGGWGPFLTEPWLSPRMEMPPPLWTLTQFSIVIMVKTSSLVGFPKLHCPLSHVLLLCTSRKSLAPSSLCPDYKAADRIKALSFIISIPNKPALLTLCQLGYIWCFCKRWRWSRGLLAFLLLSCFFRWKETFTGKVSICERLLGLPLLVPHYKSQQLSFADISYLVLFH